MSAKLKGASILSKIPYSVKHLLTLKTDEERKAYLKTLPQETLTQILKFATYVLLAGDLVTKATKLGIAIPSEVKGFLDKVQEEVKKTGKLTKEAVSTAVDVVKGTVAFGVILAVICFLAFLILNPHIALALMVSTFIVEAAIFFLGTTKPKKDDKTK